MPCFDPLDATRAEGSSDKPVVWKRGQCPRVLSPGIEHFQIPCGRCIGCRLEYSRVWGARCAHEASLHEDNCFLTLTYRSEATATDEELKNGWYLPRDGSLNKKHHQDFLKRLRYYFGAGKIKYYHCGEYGDQLNRPHYHTLLFNFDFPDKKLFKEYEGYYLFTSEIADKVWRYGYVFVGSVTFESAAYVARYCLKKIFGDLAHEHYLRYDEYGCPYWLEPEYATMSRGGKGGHGIGYEWYQKFKSDLYPLDRLPIPGRGEFGKPPRYYQELHAAMYPEEIALVRERRSDFWSENPEEGSPSRRGQRERVKLAQLAHLMREIE